MFNLVPSVQEAIITTAGTLLVALLGILAEIMRRQHKRLGEVREHVANSHTTNLRDDLDKVVEGMSEVKQILRDHTQMMHGQAEDIRGIREDLRHERTRITALEHRVDDLVLDSH